MMSGLLGAKAMAPVASVGASSVIGVQVSPESRVSHTPPLPTPSSQRLESRGSTAIEATRPERSVFGLLWYDSGAAANGAHCPVTCTADVEVPSSFAVADFARHAGTAARAVTALARKSVLMKR